MNARPWLARTLFDDAVLEIAVGGSPGRARELLDESETIARQIGMQWLLAAISKVGSEAPSRVLR